MHFCLPHPLHSTHTSHQTHTNIRSVWAISLPGHTVGHMGALFNLGKDRYAMMVGDAVWSSTAYRERRRPSRVTKFIHNGGWETYLNTIDRLHDLHLARPDIKIIPAHCAEVFKHCVQDGKSLFTDNIQKPLTASAGTKALVFGATGFLGKE
jgi:glyoxylase-like metal-dependent hydrolase (beta-lactamase superfamily II)